MPKNHSLSKIIPLIAALTLLGAGCAKTETSTTTTASAPQPQIEVTTTEETGGTLQQTQSGTDEDGVPIIDVILGGDAKSETKTENKVETQVDVAIDVSMEAGNYFFKPNAIEAKTGQTVNITFTKNAGFHRFVIVETKTKVSVNKNGKVTFTAPNNPGTYTFYCDVGSHRANGMEGKLIVK